ncbi:hypothetical protein DE146DRAFT_792690 [Phaeosphaeria sp. MPI-PUGE-AT-0046c]|nr:hypothetical protein DE146DRAFT_792690 [Phaeosphaeria sp. MPI-PUGE-AT-0046c]
MSLGLDELCGEGGEVLPITQPPGPLSAGRAETMIGSLIKERDSLQDLVDKHATTIAHLERRLYSKVTASATLSTDVVDRFHRVENDNVCLKKENLRLGDSLRVAENEAAILHNRVEEKTRKVKGANKKTKSAKKVVVKEEEKAKNAIHDKQHHVKSEQNMRKEKREALAACEEQRKLAEDLRAELEIERSENVHLRETEGIDSNNTTVVISMTLLIRRQDYIQMQDILESNRISYVDRAKEWYEMWKTNAEEEVVKIVGADYE